MDYIIQKAGVTNHFGWELKEDGIHFKYRFDDHDAVQSVLNTYPVDYLAVALPRVIDAITEKRKQSILGFTFGGLPVELDQTTQTNLVGAAVGMTRNPSITHLDWHLGYGVFTTLPRDLLLAIADASFAYIQDCFSRQRQLTEAAVLAKDIFELKDIDIHAGWPRDPMLP